MEVPLHHVTNNSHTTKQPRETRGTQCIIYANQNYANFSLSYLRKYSADFYQILIQIFCSTYTLPLIPKLKEIVLAVYEIFLPKSCLIFFIFSSSSHQNKNLFNHAKVPFSCFDFLQIWYTYRAIKGLYTQQQELLTLASSFDEIRAERQCNYHHHDLSQCIDITITIVS